MFSLTQVQYIFDYSMYTFYKNANEIRKETVARVAKVAAAATTLLNKQLNMGSQSRDVIFTAGLQATVYNAHLSGEEHLKAFDIQFVLSVKNGFEKLFGITNLVPYDKTRDKPPQLNSYMFFNKTTQQAANDSEQEKTMVLKKF